MNRIKFLREEKNILQDDLAKILNVTQKTVSNYENEARDIPTECLKILSEYFNCTIDYLLGKSDIRNPEPNTQDVLDLAKIGFTAEKYNPPTEKQRKQIKTLIETIMEDNKKENK